MPVITVDAILFDMDGTLIDSTNGVRAAWKLFGRQYNFDGVKAAHATHGRRLADTIPDWCNLSDPKLVQDEIVRFEDEVISVGPVLLPGALDLVNQINTAHPPDTLASWTIVTSATDLYTTKALQRCGVPIPQSGYITSDDVQRGKPSPDPYLAGAKKVNADPAKCVVIEDAPSGLKSGRNAGSKTIAVCTSHSREEIIASGAEPDFIIDDLTKISAKWLNGKLELTVNDSL